MRITIKSRVPMGTSSWTKKITHNYRLRARPPERFTEPLGLEQHCQSRFALCVTSKNMYIFWVWLKKFIKERETLWHCDEPIDCGMVTFQANPCVIMCLCPLPGAQSLSCEYQDPGTPGTPGTGPHRAMEVQRTLAVEVISTHKTCSGPFECLKRS